MYKVTTTVGKMYRPSTKKYIYEPVMFDRFDPKVIEGLPIENGATVIITNEKFDPRNKFVWIKDEKGNEQSVYRTSIRKHLTKEKEQ